MGTSLIQDTEIAPTSGPFLCRFVTFDIDFVGIFLGLGEAVGHLHRQPHLWAAAEGFREANRHLGRNPALAVDEIV